MTPPARIDAILATLKPDEVRDALWMIGVFERWNMPFEEANEWRRRIVAWAEYLSLPHKIEPGN